MTTGRPLSIGSDEGYKGLHPSNAVGSNVMCQLGAGYGDSMTWTILVLMFAQPIIAGQTATPALWP